MDQEIRNKLRNVVTQCRKLLEDSVSQELEGKYGIFAKKDHVTADPNAKMSHLSEEEQAARKDILDHFGHIKARGFKPKDALDQLVREIAFTHLNRLCAYKMMEAREVYVGGQKFREAVSRGFKSNGFLHYLAMDGHETDERLYGTGQQDVAYRHFLDWLGGLLSEEIGVLFNPNDSANRLYPRQKTLDAVLDLLNGGGIKPEETELRETWPKIWLQDETIGWVYQYFTPKELRDQARKESNSPRNSYELAFRNQFFTPRYVVEFLTDNTLGRIWYEMQKGETKLRDQCRYMVRRPTEIFLNDGELPPKDAAEGRDDLSQEELLKLPIHIPHHPKKDPRDLRILDPACGSGHFLLYCFDLLLTIYEEAYSDPGLGVALKKDYPALEDLRRDLPRLILAHNLHGIDIDLRASQIAALALWLRCQRAYREVGLKKDRPRITRSNFVCAEPMPGEQQMLKEFVAQLEPKLLGQLVEIIFEKMKLAGEAGSLLMIEEQIRDTVADAKKQWIRETVHATDRRGQPLLFTQAALDQMARKPEESSLFDLSEITDELFFEKAEARVVEALRDYSEKAQNGHHLQRRLFTQDAVRGFAFIDLCEKRYDVVLMNPPFGEPPDSTKEYLDSTFDEWNHNILCAFIARASATTAPQGAIGVVFDRTASIKNTYEDFRRSYFLGQTPITHVVDLGWNVLDANVEVSACVMSRSPHRLPSGHRLLWGCMLTQVALSDKDSALKYALSDYKDRLSYHVLLESLAHLPNAVIGYYFAPFVLRLFSAYKSFEEMGVKVIQGHTIKSDEYFRYFWEIPEGQAKGLSGGWARLYNGGSYSRFCMPLVDVVRYGEKGRDIETHSSTIFRNLGLQQRPGVAFGKRGEFIDAHYLPAGFVSTVEGQACILSDIGLAYRTLAVLNSRLFQYVINQYCGQHKYAGYVNLFPIPGWDSSELIAAADCCRQIIELKDTALGWDETSPTFAAPAINLSSLHSIDATASNGRAAQDAIRSLEASLNQRIYASYGLTELETRVIEEFCSREPLDSVWFEANVVDDDDARRLCAHRLVSFMLGLVFGRWDIRTVLDGDFKHSIERFSALPICSPATLQDSDGFPLLATPKNYPIRIDWDGVLVDDPDHPDDTVLRVEKVFEVIWKDRAELIEESVCETLGVKRLRDYFRKSGKGGFWDDHVARYSKSRRNAPIYWLLQSSKKNFALSLYYHRLNKDLLFKALINYVEPKIRLENSRFDTLRSQKAVAGDSSKEAKRLAKEIEQQDDFLSELRDFEDKLRRAANLHLEPDLNDGVVLNIAPMHELVPWQEAKKHWDELLDGKYEWSSIGKQLRQKGLVK